ncbi:hypothetical protein PRIPAC_88779 [Pristionchus pacificus]|uniref:Uncharacterized protein n=1 Tax=Pristionchus pacificus TaxID=54126 RepID=A0A2A6CWI2_PRIPA|nr:hypothetical protein PRIPAC_88779 [Pristionchus pacificus]|eukprot:PDM82393.1 hypothetical protein PRIPAC_36786 [Pristionchus pacificus]
MCGQMGHLTRLCKQQTAFIIRSSFGTHEANPNGKDHTEEKVIGKDHTVEKVITEVECETEGFRDHKAPAVIENVIVKVECEAGSARDHNAPEAKVKSRKVKIREPEAKESNLVKIHESVANDNMIVKVRRPEANANEKKMEYSLQNRQYSDKVKRESPETTTIEESNCNERIDIGRTDTEGSPVREKALEIGKMDVPSIEHRGDNQMKDDNFIPLRYEGRDSSGLAQILNLTRKDRSRAKIVSDKEKISGVSQCRRRDYV